MKIITTTLEQLLAYLGDDNNRVAPNFEDGGFVYKSPFKHIFCADGYALSVQAAQGAYCTPRNNDGPWTHVEVWMCGDVPEFNLTAAYATRGEEPYSTVPVAVVAEVIAKHGGFAQ